MELTKLELTKFINDSPSKIPSMTVHVYVDHKNIEQFRTPEGFRLDKYALEENPNCTCQLYFDKTPQHINVITVIILKNKKEIKRYQGIYGI